MREEAAAAPIAFAVSGMILLAGIGVVMLSAQQVAGPGDVRDTDAANKHGQAEALLSLLIESPGFASNAAWDTTVHDSDDILRPGLLDSSTNLLDQKKFNDLRVAAYAAADDGKLNYEEAREKLGLDDAGLDFHIRALPSLQDVRDKLAKGLRDENLRVTYVGDVDGSSSSSPTWTAPVCEKSPFDDDYFWITMDIDNQGGTQTQFQVRLEIDDGPGANSVYFANSPIAAIGSTVPVQVDVPNHSNVDCVDGTEFKVTVSDISTSLDTQTYTTHTSTGTPTATTEDFVIELDQQHYVAGDVVTIRYSGAATNDGLSWVVHDGLLDTDPTVPSLSGTHTVPSQQADRFFQITLPSIVTDTDRYRIAVTNDDEAETATQLIAFRKNTGIALADYSPGTASADTAMVTEIGFIEQIVQNFCPANYNDATTSWDPAWDAASLATRCAGRDIPAWQGGDVFWDDKDVIGALCERLVQGTSDGSCPSSGHVGRIDWTNVLIIGSHVDHNSMTKGTFKWPLEAWVEAGGTLIVFGSPDSATEWLQPIFSVGHAASSGGIASPDSTHPILNRPNPLDFDTFDTQGEGWRFTNGADDDFTNVVMQGDDPITSVSDSGSYGEGNVIISTWLPYDPYGDGTGTDQGLAMMDNFIMHSYRDLFLDYGPPLPTDVPVEPAFGRAQINHDKLGFIEMDFTLFVFAG